MKDGLTIEDRAPFKDPAIAKQLIAKIRDASLKPVRLMEVCGTHTVSIFRSGIRSLLPETISLLSGPGCPVCVTDQGEIDAFIRLSREEKVITATFGDLLRVPGSGSTLLKERAAGRDIRAVYSPMDAVAIARENPKRKIVFPGIGFETTAPAIAAAILTARSLDLKNFFVFSAHKTVPRALAALLETEAVEIDGFILPGHVSVIIGSEAYRPLFERHRIPCAIAGFEPADILLAVWMLISAIEKGEPLLENGYGRAVAPGGNQKAIAVMEQVFAADDARWRGLGTIPGSGLVIREEFADFDAAVHFGIEISDVPPPRGCACGQILTGKMIPPQCPLYDKVCTPLEPVGPCMVSSEGTCAAYHKFHSPPS